MPNKIAKEKEEIIKKNQEKPIVKTARKLTGTATRDSLSKTVPVKISYINIHPLYKKRFATSKKILAHTEMEVLRGQMVTIEESRKVSKNKAWKVINVQKEEVQG